MNGGHSGEWRIAMAKVVPSQVVEYLDARYPEAAKPGFWLGIDHTPVIANLLALVENIPAHLVALPGAEAAEFGEAILAMRFAVNRWNAGEKNYVFKDIPGRRQTHPLALLRKHLSSLHDEGVEGTTNQLSFISEPAFRNALRRDLGAIDRCIENGEWKAATVLGGSVVEALLLYALHEYEKTNSDALQSTVQALRTQGTFQKAPAPDLDDWVLHQLTEVSAAVSLIQTETAAQCRIAKNFRNLIHPGRAARLAQRCDRGTAFSTVAAVEHVMRDLSP
jgi:hypothetical protein